MYWIKTGLFVVGLAALCGCETNSEKHFGEAHRAVTAQMIANPDAGKQPADGVSELEGETVENVMTQYRKGQTEVKSDALPSAMIGTGTSSK